MNDTLNTEFLVKLYTLAHDGDFDHHTCPFHNKSMQTSITVPWAALEFGMQYMPGCHFDASMVLPMGVEARLKEETAAADLLWNFDEPAVLQYTYNFSVGFKRPEKFMFSRGYCLRFADLCADSGFSQRLDYETGYRSARSHASIWRTSNGMTGDRFVGRAPNTMAQRSAMFKKIQELRDLKHPSAELLIQ